MVNPSNQPLVWIIRRRLTAHHGISGSAWLPPRSTWPGEPSTACSCCSNCSGAVLVGGGCFGGQGVELLVVDAFPVSAAGMVDTFT